MSSVYDVSLSEMIISAVGMSDSVKGIAMADIKQQILC